MSGTWCQGPCSSAASSSIGWLENPVTPASKSSRVSHFSSRWLSNSTSSPVVAAQYRPGVCAMSR